MKIQEMEVDRSVVRKIWRKQTLSCSFCPPNQFENRKKNGKWKSKSWKDKTKKKKQFEEPKVGHHLNY